MSNASTIQLNGLHHVTAITSHAQENVAFYVEKLGLRLVKKTVNQDDVSAYHLFYADAKGSPGTDMTFFEWAGIRPTRHGAGEVTETAFRVLGGVESLLLWKDWFAKQHIRHGQVEIVSGFPTLAFEDGEGQKLRLIAQGSAGEQAVYPWKGSPVPVEAAIVGLGAVTLTVEDAATTGLFLTKVLNFRQSDTEPTLFETGAGGPGSLLHLKQSDYRGAQGAGGVHHVAWRVDDEVQLLAWQKRVEQAGYRTSGEVDRHYFRSLYFRIPGNILFEIATDGPGFTSDGEPEDALGEKLALPPFLEPHRKEIEAGIRPLNYQPSVK